MLPIQLRGVQSNDTHRFNELMVNDGKRSNRNKSRFIGDLTFVSEPVCYAFCSEQGCCKKMRDNNECPFWLYKFKSEDTTSPRSIDPRTFLDHISKWHYKKDHLESGKSIVKPIKPAIPNSNQVKRIVGNKVVTLNVPNGATISNGLATGTSAQIIASAAMAPTMSFSSNGAPFLVKENMIPVTIAQIGSQFQNNSLKSVPSNSISIGVASTEPKLQGQVTQKIEPKMEPLLKHRFNPAFDASLVNVSAAKTELSVALESFAEKFNIEMDFGSSTGWFYN